VLGLILFGLLAAIVGVGVIRRRRRRTEPAAPNAREIWKRLR
jgi:hypothetical protein